MFFGLEFDIGVQVFLICNPNLSLTRSVALGMLLCLLVFPYVKKDSVDIFTFSKHPSMIASSARSYLYVVK